MEPKAIRSLAELGQRIEELRRARGLSQEDLARLCGISRKPIYMAESGKGAIRADTLITILDTLGAQISLEVMP